MEWPRKSCKTGAGGSKSQSLSRDSKLQTVSLLSCMGLDDYSSMMENRGTGLRRYVEPSLSKNREMSFTHIGKPGTCFAIGHRGPINMTNKMKDAASRQRFFDGLEQGKGSDARTTSTPVCQQNFGTDTIDCIRRKVKSSYSSNNLMSRTSPVIFGSSIFDESVCARGSQFSSRLSTASLSDVLREALNNPEVDYVEIEGHPYSKRMLAEWAVKYLKHSILRTTREIGTQTESESEHSDSVLGHLSTSSTLIECKPDSMDASTLTDIKPGCSDVSTLTDSKPDCLDAATATDIDETVTIQSETIGMKNETAKPNSTQSVVTSQQPASVIPSLMGNYHQQSQYGFLQLQQQPVSLLTTNPQQYPTVNKQYEEAKNWKPKNVSEAKALEQAISDVYNVLLVYKGCSLKRLLRLFQRTVQEMLDFGKIGVPNLKTLLVQMESKILLKKERYSGDKYLLPNIGAEEFEIVAHIGEMVAEQRDKEPLPHSSLLIDCDISELFEQPHQINSQHYQNTSFGPIAYPAANTTYPYYSPYANSGFTQPLINYGNFGFNDPSNVNHQFRQYYQQFYHARNYVPKS